MFVKHCFERPNKHYNYLDVILSGKFQIIVLDIVQYTDTDSNKASSKSVSEKYVAI